MDPLMLADLSGKVVLDGLLQKFESSSGSWYYALETAAQSLFWKLALCSLAWTFISMLFRDEVRDFAAELVRFLLFTGLAWWGLINGPAFGQDILNTCIQLGGQAGGFGGGLSPATIADLGLQIFNQVVSPLNWILAPGISLAAMILAMCLVFAAVVTACNLLLLVVSGWVAAAAGLVLLGFGGCRWTSDMAANYFRGMLSIGMKILTMEMVLGIGVAFAKEVIAGVTFPLSLTGIMVLSALFVALAFVSDRLPNVVSGMVGSFIGYSIGNTSWGSGMSAAVTTAGMAAGAATQTTATAVGAVQAVKEALQAATDAGKANGNANGSMAGMQALAPQPAQPNGAAKAARYAGAVASTVGRGAGQMAVDSIKQSAASTYPGRLAAAIRQQQAKTQKPRNP
jgi:type IV secretion system protein TrbL